MKTRLTLLLLSVPILLSSACATTGKAGECKSYRPISMCSPGFEEQCQTTRDGCEQCGCVPIVDDAGRAPYDPR